ncbi:uncharacterized protein MONBRDRAFT_32070 [Monosiga brevicollis MX1]|uniref:Vacuolar protein sorting-associated protein 16 homolog n=1 Tax=Monosiga brevicollis TaxID=81824 RepID=A9UX85_MONBE|nr:uncharacterized protein MONBRDRAFT_32070 [Monosiga brevicollis MX1]EDQ90175.1 predicted protein [Monosiga brevicollis MX1]|eukprot:XP_001744942.1 hypothetical protein [Monosiga brevicollis MX1]
MDTFLDADDAALNDLREVHQANIYQGWFKSGSQNFRIFDVYKEMGWYHRRSRSNIELANYISAVSPDGGAIALIRDTSQPQLVMGSSDANVIHIFSPAGYKMSEIKWRGRGRIVGMGWTNTENLIVFDEENGAGEVFSMQGEFIRSVEVCNDRRVIHVEFSHGGEVAVLQTSNHELHVAVNLDDPRCYQLKGIEDIEDDGISAYAIWSTAGNVKVLVAANRCLYAVTKTTTEEVLDMTHRFFIRAIAVSADEEKIALFHGKGRVSIATDSFRSYQLELDTQTDLEPDAFVWCGNSAVIAYWNETKLPTGTGVYMLIPLQHRETRITEEDCYKDMAVGRLLFVHERDGLRVIGETEHQFWQEIPRETYRTIIEASSPENMLLMARMRFEKRQAKADRLLRDIMGQDPPGPLPEAVVSLVQAAGYEWDMRTSRYLLKAARFGMDFCDTSSDDFIAMCRDLRIIKHLRTARVAMPLTIDQYRALTVEVIIDRLIARGVHWLAHEICKFLKLENMRAMNKVLVHWARTVISKHDGSDEQVADILIRKLAHKTGIRFVEIAQAAAASGRRELAVRLVKQEASARLQVPALLEFREYEDALRRALLSGDPDMITVALEHLKKAQGNIAAFHDVLRQYENAQPMYELRCRRHNLETLKAFYNQLDLNRKYAVTAVRLACESSSTSECMRELSEARERFACVKEDGPMLASIVEQQMTLLRWKQEVKQKRPEEEWNSLSVRDAIYRCICLHDEKTAERMAKENKVSDKQFWWIKIKALVHNSDFRELERFSKSKSPVGYEPFIVECLKKRQPQEAAKYIVKLPKAQQVQFWLKAGKYQEAITTAVALKSDDLLDDILSYGQQSGRRDIVQLVNQARS